MSQQQRLWVKCTTSGGYTVFPQVSRIVAIQDGDDNGNYTQVCIGEGKPVYVTDRAADIIGRAHGTIV